MDTVNNTFSSLILGVCVHSINHPKPFSCFKFFHKKNNKKTNSNFYSIYKDKRISHLSTRYIILDNLIVLDIVVSSMEGHRQRGVCVLWRLLVFNLRFFLTEWTNLKKKDIFFHFPICNKKLIWSVQCP